MVADGSIIIDTRIQTDGLSNGLNAIKAGMTRITAQVSKMGETARGSFQRQIATVNSLYQSYEKQERKVAELKSKLDELGKSKIETEGYKLISDSDMQRLMPAFLSAYSAVFPCPPIFHPTAYPIL